MTVHRGLSVATERFALALPSCHLAFAITLAVLSGSGFAAALGPAGSEIDTSDYTIDLHQGPITASSRVIGLAGTIAPITEGVDGFAVNPASAAMRAPWSRSWVDGELDFGFTRPTSITRSDFDNNGNDGFANNAATFVNAGACLQLGAWGLGLGVDVGQYRVQARDPGTSVMTSDLSVSLVRGNIVIGYSFGHGELVLGYGIAISSVELDLPEADASELELGASVEGFAMQLGATWAPQDLPLRAGVGVRFPVSDKETPPEGVVPDDQGDYVAQGYYFPREIRIPAELHVALAVQWFRPLNMAWYDPDDANGPRDPSQKARRARGNKLLIAAALTVTGSTTNGVGVESFFSQAVERSGRRTSWSPRLGVEGEPLADGLLLRAGTYLEPTRFNTSSPRPHATAGFDVHVPVAWSVFGLFDDDTTFRVGGALDSAARYFAWTASLGIWR